MAVFAHPDDEAYLAGGLLAALRDAAAGGVHPATRGAAGNGLHDGGAAEARSALAAIRTDELMRSLRIVGVSEHHWLGYGDTQCESVDDGAAVGRVQRLMATIGPQTVVGFGLQAQKSQTAELIAAIGLGRFARWVSTECFRVDTRRSCDRDEMSEGPDPVVIDHRMRSPGNAVQALPSNAMAP